MNEDAVIACADLVGRGGARSFELAWDCPHDTGDDEHACPLIKWSASAQYQGARLFVDGHDSPSLAAMALAERLLAGAICRCRKPVTLSDRPGCRWRLVRSRWEPGCNAPTIKVDGRRGDVAAMRRALGEVGS